MLEAPGEHVDLERVRPAEREELWERALSSTHADMAVRLAGDRGAFRASLRRRWIGDLALVDAWSDPCSGVRGKVRVGRTAEHRIGLLMTLSGRETIHVGDSVIEMTPGDAVIWDNRYPTKFDVRERVHKQTLVIPPEALETVEGGRSIVVGGTVLRAGSPGVRLLSGYLELLAGKAGKLDVVAGEAARSAALQILVAAVGGANTLVGSNAGEASLRDMMDAWIERHLPNSEKLTPHALAAAHSVSVRTVFRVFAESGDTVGAVVRRRRLARARQALVTTTVSIADIATNWGFSDASHFTRSFRREYGHAPSELRLGQAAREYCAS